MDSLHNSLASVQYFDSCSFSVQHYSALSYYYFPRHSAELQAQRDRIPQRQRHRRQRHAQLKTLVDFPIERSRLRSIWWIVLVFIATTALYGFSLSLYQITLSLLLQFFIAYTATTVYSFKSALVIDLYPGASASVTAVNNLMRCSVGAVGVAVTQLTIDSLGSDFALLVLARLTAALSPLVLLEWFYSEGWRRVRAGRLAVVEARKKEMELGKEVRIGN